MAMPGAMARANNPIYKSGFCVTFAQVNFFKRLPKLIEQLDEL